VIPFRIEDVPPGKSLDYFIGSVHWLDALTPPLEQHLKRLVQNVRTLLSRDAPVIEPKVTTASVAPTSSLRAPSTSLVAPKRRPAKWPYAALTAVAVLLIAYGAVFFAHKPPPLDNMGFPSRWKSTMSGSVRTLRFQGNYIYGEVLLPDAAVKAGAFTLLEFTKAGDRFIGKVNRKIVRADGRSSCPVESQIELTLVTPQRIEGRSMEPPLNAYIDWTKCSFSPGPEWQHFTWIPII
jgi:hypothetical protein